MHTSRTTPDLAAAGETPEALEGLGLAHWWLDDAAASIRRPAVASHTWDTSFGLDRPPIVGNSQGGRWALELALRHPSRVARLILVGAPAGSRARVPLPMLALRWPVTRPLVKRVFRRAEPKGVRDFFGRVNLVHAERLPHEFLVATAAGQRRNYPSLLSFATRVMTYWSIHPDLLMPARWREVHVPVHFIWGEEDSFDSPSTGQAAVPRVAAGAEITTVPGAGHLPWLDAPEAVASAIQLSLDPTPTARRSPPGIRTVGQDTGAPSRIP